MEEVYKPVLNFEEKYLVSNYGNIIVIKISNVNFKKNIFIYFFSKIFNKNKTP